jgi:hypothetical protein
LVVYNDGGTEVDLNILYKLWETRMRKRGLVPNMSKYVEEILAGHIKMNHGILKEYKEGMKEISKSVKVVNKTFD